MAVIQITTKSCIIPCIGIGYLEASFFQDFSDFSAGFIFFIGQLRMIRKVQTESYGFVVMFFQMRNTSCVCLKNRKE